MVERTVDEVEILGIDLGTTNSAVAIWEVEAEQVRVLPNQAGNRITPSVVFIDPDTQETIIGKAALAKFVYCPEQVIYSVKRFIGRTFKDDCVSQDQQQLAYALEETHQRKVAVRVGEQLYSPPKISAHILRQLKADAEAFLSKSFTRAVITVPAYFTESQRQATKEAAEHAGLHVPRIINEPTAAALAFGLKQDPQTIAVYDLGGGTFDISILDIKPGGLFRVKAADGDTHLGGDDFDRAIIDWLRQTFKAQHGADLEIKQDRSLRARLKKTVKAIKVGLTTQTDYAVNLPDLCEIEGQSLGLETVLTRTQFEALIQPFVDQTLEICDRVLKKAKLQPTDIQQVLMIGGQTRTPAIKQALRDKYNWLVNDSVNPDEAVAQGAAVLAARLQGYLRDEVTLWDVTPLSLGVELESGKMDVIIDANQQIPITKWRKGAQSFSTNKDGQERIRFRVYQGERPKAADNAYIGELILNLATSRPAGEPRIHCMFKIDQDGILHVRAEDVSTDGEPVEATFDHVYRLTQKEVEAKRQEAEIHQEEDTVTNRLFQIEEELKRLQRTAKERSTICESLEDLETAISARKIDRAEALLTEVKKQLFDTPVS